MLSARMLLPPPETRKLLLKWVIALLIPLAVFTFVWSGEGIINNVFLSYVSPGEAILPFADWPSLIEATVFIGLLYLTIIALVGYLVAADSGRRGMSGLWIDMLFQVVAPLLLVQA